MKTPERRQWRRYGVFIVDFEHVNANWVQGPFNDYLTLKIVFTQPHPFLCNAS